MSDSVLEIDNVSLSDDCEGDKSQNNEVVNTDSSETRGTNLRILGSTEIGVFGYRFKGPEKFTDQSYAEHLNSEILHYIEHRRCSTGRYVSKDSARGSIGHNAGLHEMSKFPLRFNSVSMEMLFSLNLNDWMIKRMPFISILIFIVTLVFWPLSVVAFKRTGVWNDREYIFILFHSVMAVTCVLSFVPLIGFFKRFYNMTEKICYVTLGMINFLFGFWLILSSYNLRHVYSESTIYDLITAREAIKALTYLYSILPIVALDSFMPTRSSKTWWIHFQFVVIYSITTITKGNVTPIFISWVFIVFRIFAFASIISFLYFGSYNAELQTRISFFNWISTSRKIDLLEKDIAEAKSPDKSFTPAENILMTMESCIKIANHTMDAAGDMLPEITGSLDHMCNAMKTCVDQLTHNPNLYYIPKSQIYKKLGNEADIVETYISSFFEPPLSTKSSSSASKLVKFSETQKTSVSSDVRLKQYVGAVSSIETKVNLFQLLNDWNFSVLGHFKENSQPFVSMGHCLLRDFQAHYSVPQDTILNFLSVVEGLYKDVSYHNRIHGMFVAQKMCCLANFVGIYDQMSNLDKGILVVAGLCHDLGHPGKTNSFFVNSGHDIANLFNDKSVLENFHSCLTFKVLKMEECNIFGFLDRDDFRNVRRRIIDLILATDMEDHFESISRFRLKRISQDFSLEDDIWNICKILIKASDIGSACVPWDLSYEWSRRLLCEFYAQGELEKSLDLSISSIFDSSRHRDVPKAQSGFLSLVVAPLFEELSKLPHHPNLYKNRPHIITAQLTQRSSFYTNDDKPTSSNPNEEPSPSIDNDSLHYVEMMTGNIRIRPRRNTYTTGSSVDNKKHHSQPRFPFSNRVYDVCIFQLRQNIERWEQMADLGEAVPIDDFPNDDVQLDVHLVLDS